MSLPARILPPCSPYQAVKSLHAAEAERGGGPPQPTTAASATLAITTRILLMARPGRSDDGPARCRQAPRAGEDIPQREDQDADGQGIEERLDPGHLRPHAAQRQS